MAAQAAVLLVTSSTDVNLANLVKRASNGGGKTGQKRIVILEEMLVDLEQQFRAKRVERQKYLDALLDIKRARRLQDYNYLRMAYLQNQ
ncbi:hypothetical protein BASA81_014254 [Batrachochytrium salamandrivorans]|nr:hypothetical protein BASA81_014254 [Batrachochytrium salamandrivorans]